jgi:hypothetical protein
MTNKTEPSRMAIGIRNLDAILQGRMGTGFGRVNSLVIGPEILHIPTEPDNGNLLRCLSTRFPVEPE